MMFLNLSTFSCQQNDAKEAQKKLVVKSEKIIYYDINILKMKEAIVLEWICIINRRSLGVW